jgi:hypothetical protein
MSPYHVCGVFVTSGYAERHMLTFTTVQAEGLQNVATLSITLPRISHDRTSVFVPLFSILAITTPTVQNAVHHLCGHGVSAQGHPCPGAPRLRIRL